MDRAIEAATSDAMLKGDHVVATCKDSVREFERIQDSSLSAGALFAGIGGFCSGFARADIHTKWAIEYDKQAVETYRANFPNVRIVSHNDQPADIREVSVLGDRLESVDVLHAGFPCQSFSMAGNKKGFDDDRGKLFYEVVRLLNEFGAERPSVVVLENSPHLLTGDRGRWFLEVSTNLKNAGYWFRNSNAFVLDTYDVSDSIQHRKRLFMVAFSTERFSNGFMTLPTPENNARKKLSNFIDFELQVDDSYYLDESNRYHSMISSHYMDQSRLYQLRKFLVRVKEPDTCPTLTANMGQGGHNVPFVYNYKGLRKLTEYECLRIQGFPESFIFPESVARTRRYMQVGNSVSPPVAELLARAIYRKVELERDK